MANFYVKCYQDFDIFDISNIFYNVTNLDKQNIFDLSISEEFDLVLEARLENDIFGIRVNSFETKETISRILVIITFYSIIDNTIHKNNVQKMFNNWTSNICKKYKLLIEQYNKEHQITIQNEINQMKVVI
jgi:hypothetical protein